MFGDARRLLILLAAFMPAPMSAQTPPAGQSSQFLENRMRLAVSAASFAGISATTGGEIARLGVVLHPDNQAVWLLEEDSTARPVGPAKAAVLPNDILDRVVDHTLLQLSAQNASEAWAYHNFLVAAAKTTPEAFARSVDARVTLFHILNQPKTYRGRVLHVEGRLKRLFHWDPTELEGQEGVHDVYEGWITADAANSPLVWVLFADLPPGLTLKQEGKADNRVSFDGYFFKLASYKAGDATKAKMLEAPLLIGRTVHLLDPASAREPSLFGDWIVVVVVVLAVGTVFLFFGLAWWLRRGDERTRLRLAQARMAKFAEPESSEQQTA